jgi:hypothetical protein
MNPSSINPITPNASVPRAPRRSIRRSAVVVGLSLALAGGGVLAARAEARPSVGASPWGESDQIGRLNLDGPPRLVRAPRQGR